MSAYSDWKCGALSDEEYTSHCNWEAAMDKYLEELDDREDDEDTEDDEEE